MIVSAEKNGDNCVIVSISEDINPQNAGEFHSTFKKIIDSYKDKNILLDAKNLNVITSAGLRTIHDAIIKGARIRIINTNDKLYNLFERTGFVELTVVDRPILKINLDDNARVLGSGWNSTVYLYDNDKAVKVYRDKVNVNNIKLEFAKTRKAFTMGLPTVIPYSLAEVNGKKAGVYEYVKARNFAKLLVEDKNNLHKYIDEYVSSVKQFHNVEVTEKDKEILDDATLQIKNYRNDIEGYADPKILKKLDKIIDEFAVGSKVIHGDIQPGNIMVKNGHLVFGDLDTLAYGNPEFDLIYLYNTLVNFRLVMPTVEDTGIEEDMADEIWKIFVQRYFNIDDEDFVKNKERIYKPIGLCRVYRWMLRHIPDSHEKIAAAQKAFEDAVREY